MLLQSVGSAPSSLGPEVVELLSDLIAEFDRLAGKHVNAGSHRMRSVPRAYVRGLADVRGSTRRRVKQVGEGVRVTLAATVLFPSGGAELSTAGQAALTRIAETLRKRTGVTIAVEGFHAMELAQVDSVAEVVSVGDTPLDLQAGANAGLRGVVGVLSGAFTAEKLRSEPHTHIVQSVANLPALLASKL